MDVPSWCDLYAMQTHDEPYKTSQNLSSFSWTQLGHVLCRD